MESSTEVSTQTSFVNTDIESVPCNQFACTITIVVIYCVSLFPAFFGFEASRRGTKTPTCSKILYHLQFGLGCICCFALLALAFIITFSELKVCNSFRGTFNIWIVMLSSSLVSSLLLVFAIWMGWIYRSRLNIQSIKYTSGAVH